MQNNKVSLLWFHIVPWATLLFGLGLTYLLHDTALEKTRLRLQAEFDIRADDLAALISKRLYSYEQVLAGTAALFVAKGSVDRRQFASYVDALRLTGRYAGIQGVGFAQYIAPEAKAAHIAAVRAEGFPDYDIRPAGERPVYTSIIYLEPFDWRNRRAFGFDMYSEPVRQQAMARARDENATVISGRVQLVQETEQGAQSGFLMYVPVYRTAATSQSAEVRQASLDGWVYAPFRMNDLMAGLLGEKYTHFASVAAISIHDGPVPDPAALLFVSHQAGAAAAPLFRAQRAVPLFGRQWTVTLTSLPDFDARLGDGRANLVALAGGSASVLLALVMWLLATSHSRALTMAGAMTAELRQSEQNKNALFENMSSGVAVFDVHEAGHVFIFTAFNHAAEKISQLSRTEVLGRQLEDVFPGSAAIGLVDVMQRVWHSGVAETCPESFYQDTRLSGWRETFVYRLPDQSLVVMFNDVTERKQSDLAQQKLNRALHLLSDCNMALVHAEEEYRLLAEICRLIVERGGYRLAWVGYAEQDEARSVRPIAQAGYESGYLDTLNISWGDNIQGQGPTGTAIRTGKTSINPDVLSNPAMAPWRQAAIQRGYQSSIALPLIHDRQVLGALNIYASEADAFNPEEVHLLEELAGDLAYGIVTLRTRKEHVAVKEKMDFMSYFDELTRLPNRLLLRDRFEQAVQTLQPEKSFIALLYLDIDDFKQINDSLGRGMGDRLLVSAVGRLQQCVAAADTISRLSGDEFVILLGGMRDVASVEVVANRIIKAFVDPMAVDGHVLSTTFSIGISLYPADGRDFDTLLNHADTAVHAAKEAGRNTYRFFTRQMNLQAMERMQLLGQLHSAVRNRELRLHYQPQVSTASGRIVGMEALVRWEHPLHGLVSPARFIPLAEQSGHIIEIGEWVMHEACRQARTWMDKGHGPLVMAVNLSALQFKRTNVLQLVSAALSSSGLPPECLEVELTESILLDDLAGIMQVLNSLKAMGVKLSIDDFGTGYSSLAYLKQLAVNKLKIDQSFVRDMLQAPDSGSIVKAIVEMGHALQLTVIAEGVETEEELQFLRNLGCDEVQGYLYSTPVPAEEFVKLLQQNH